MEVDQVIGVAMDERDQGIGSIANCTMPLRSEPAKTAPSELSPL